MKFTKWVYAEGYLGHVFTVPDTEELVINYQDLQGIGMTHKLAPPTLIALCSTGLGRLVQSSLVVMEILV